MKPLFASSHARFDMREEGGLFELVPILVHEEPMEGHKGLGRLALVLSDHKRLHRSNNFFIALASLTPGGCHTWGLQEFSE
jgi:hypothetical protein